MHTSSLAHPVLPQPDSRPVRIGSWDIVRLVGEGSWSRVYQVRPLGRATSQPADYVLKTLKPACAQRPECIAMLRRELEVAQAVPQTHLLPALASQLDASPHFIVMPYVSGVSIAHLLRSERRLDVPDAAWIVRQAAEALIELHRHGWLHGDIKPANLLISPQGHVTLLDCGLARRLQSRECHADYQVAGTLEYSAPELLASGEPIGERSDTYALGISLFQMVTGELPFQANDVRSCVQAHLQQAPPPVRSIVPYLPQSLTHLLRRMLAKQPLERPNATELVAELCAIEIDTFHERPSAR